VARTKDANSAETYGAILRAARELIFAEGLDGATHISMRRIASLAGVSFGTLSYYFPTKEELLERCLDGHYERVDKLVEEVLEHTKSTLSTAGGVDLVALMADATRRFYRLSAADRAELLLRSATNAERGGLHPERRVNALGRNVERGAIALAHITGQSEADCRLAINSIMALIVRYVTLDDAALTTLLGEATEASRQKLEDHVVELSVRIALPVTRP
jgi:AcrR family transcriptional regulator